MILPAEHEVTVAKVDGIDLHAKLGGEVEEAVERLGRVVAPGIPGEFR